MSDPTQPTSPTRRRFMHQAGLAATLGIAAAELGSTSVLAAQAVPAPGPRERRPIRIRGRVRTGTAGLAGVAVTDGQTVVATDRDGRFTLVADGHQPFIHVSLPAGFEIPRNETGTARLYQPIVRGANDEAEVVFDLTRRAGSDERHTFLVLPDTQTQNAEEMAMLHGETVPDIKAFVASLGGAPVFGAAVGDIMFDDLTLFPEYERAVRETGAPFFQVVGNHDIEFDARSAELTLATFMRHFGPPYYSFNLGAVHYIVLQDVLWHGTAYVGYVDERQLRWLEADLALVEKGRSVVVLLHIPILGMRWKREGQPRPSPSTSVNNRAALYALLDGYRVHVISGHTHENEHVFEEGLHEHVHGTTCGAWWSGPICHDGTPAGYGIYEAHGEELRWTYKATGQPLDYQVRVYPPGSDATAPDEIVANVWNWDPRWMVEWVADGVPRGPMARRNGYDPLSVELHRGPELPPRRPWVEPGRTDHLFYAPVSADMREIVVRATDRFGRTFTGSWRR